MRRKLKLFVCITLVISIMLSLTVSSIALNEDESTNDVPETATRIYDDTNNYGYIGILGDVDWWVVSFETDGMVNFYLGSIPTNCDYDMYIYKNDGTTLIASSTTEGNELIRCRVYKDTNYRIKIIPFSGYSTTSKYKLRVKLYNLYDAKFFTCDAADPSKEIDTRETASLSIPYLWNMGWTAGEYLHNSASAAYTVLPTTDIFVSHNHGSPGYQLFDKSDGTKTYLYANKTIDTDEVNRALSDFSSGQLSEVDLIMFVGCNLGVTDSTYGNLVDMAYDKGAYCSVGWLNFLYDDVMNYWVSKFFEKCKDGATVKDAMLYADNEVAIHSVYSAYKNSAFNRYYGNDLVKNSYEKLIIGGTK